MRHGAAATYKHIVRRDRRVCRLSTGTCPL